MKLGSASLVLVLAGSAAQATVFDDCVLKNMPTAQTDFAAKAVKEACVGASEQELPLNLSSKLGLDAKYGPIYGGDTGIIISANNQTGHDITEIRFQIVNKTTDQAGLTYSIRTFYGGSIFAFVLPNGQSAAAAIEINERPIPGKSFFDTYTWQIVGLKGW